jgi:hypothetical protein
MKSKLVALAVIAAGTVFGFASQAFANTYNVNLTVGGATATGFISGILGNSSADIGAPFNLTLTEGSTSATLVGLSGPGGNAGVAAENGNAVTVTDSQVLFNFSNSSHDYLLFQLGNTFDTLLCFQTYASFCGGTGPGIVLLVNGDPFQSMTGIVVIASNDLATTPLPPALPLFATGLGVLGLLGLRKKRKGAAATAAA